MRNQFVELDGVIFNKSHIRAITKYFGNGYDSDKTSCVFFGGGDDSFFLIRMSTEEIVEALSDE